MDTKPGCTLTDTDGNVFAGASRASTTLREANQAEPADEMWARLMAGGSYDAALALFRAYVEGT